MKRIALLVACPLLAASFVTSAHAAGDYRGVLSVATHGHLLDPFNLSLSFHQQHISNDLAPRTAGQLKLAYQANRFWGVEASYGRGSNVAILPLKVQADSRTAGLDAVGTLQVSSAFAVMARAGLRRLSLESDPAQLIPNGNLNQAKLGLGLQYQFNRSLGFRAEMERYRNVGADRAVADTDGDAVRFDVYWRF